ncbi:hypothetical protein ACWDT6_11805 [Nocardia grenadensis]
MRGSTPTSAQGRAIPTGRSPAISGVYDPARDEEARFRVETLRAAFDALIPIRETTPVRWLPETGTA